ncbi:diol dehydratase reactivase subunit alpha [Planotetraspora kaengkrachanensis]|uniref:Diol dehydratase reactivase subunit alpha n=1 Tax=Planotetraspora kaengkrachanensis TaxID=575193 RepID=A0A8J3PZB0_9ACTN|nr:diol dehydratase reactivase subunit alpha [Planotetraspora kaengkrachanensis]GIG83896.1 diol dehydratase reactivase subunit alpha [Planotetraspora kaengkrachanensis]
MSLVVGVDIGNSTTEACAADVGADGEVTYLSAALGRTTGVKGTVANVPGVVEVVVRALKAAGRDPAGVRAVLVNEATPVISGLAMETITETVITESTMIGHNPDTPGGVGLGVGTTVAFADLPDRAPGDAVICVAGADADFEDVAAGINAAVTRGVRVTGAVVQADDATLIANRLREPVPVVDEVTLVHRVPLGMPAAVEVAEQGRTIRTLSNSYGIATVFGLDPEQTRMIAPVARALVGNRSAVVVRTPSGDVTGRRIPAGILTLIGERTKRSVEVDAGAKEIMETWRRVRPLADADGEPGTHVGGMLARVRDTMADLTAMPRDAVRIQDVLAVDTFVPQRVTGGLAGEFALENAVALAAMVRTSRGPMELLADRLREALGTDVLIGGVEADMALLGALTTPGTAKPMAILDLGGGSTDAAVTDEGADEGAQVRSVHLAGAGDLVTSLIDSELGLDDTDLAEEIKKFPLAKAESFFHIRMEDGTVRFFDEALPAEAFARVVVLTDAGMRPIRTGHGVERIRQVRRSAKQRVFVTNALRALEQVAPGGDIRRIGFVVVLGGAALDFEIPDMIAEAVSEFGIVSGTGNVRGSEGPRNAVATGLVAGHASAHAASTAVRCG